MPIRAATIVASLTMVIGCDATPPQAPAPQAQPAASPSPSPAWSPEPCPLIGSKEWVLPPPKEIMESGPIRPGLRFMMIPTMYGPGEEKAPFRYKLPWFVRDYNLKVEVHRIDAPGVGKVWIDDSPTFPGERPGEWGIAGDVEVPAAGCWRVTASNPDGTSVSFIFKVPRDS